MSSSASESSPPLQSPLPVTSPSWYGVPDQAQPWLALASAHWDQPHQADGYMNQALALAADHPDVLVSAYRYFFYTHNYPRALQVATTVLDLVRRTEALPQDWPQLAPILTARRDHPLIRLYINAYAASGLILARQGDADAARTIATQVSTLEHRNEFGGRLVRQILDQPDQDEGD